MRNTWKDRSHNNFYIRGYDKFLYTEEFERRGKEGFSK